MKLVRARSKVVLLEDDGRINAPFSFFLNTFKNPNTQESMAGSLKVLHSFIRFAHIDLPARAVEGRCLEEREINALLNIAYRPLAELNNERLMARYTDVRNAELDEHRKGAVDPGTAELRVKDIAAFLTDYLQQVSKYIRSADTRAQLSSAYQGLCSRLKKAVGGAAASSYHVRSMSSDDFIRLFKAVYCRASEVLPASDAFTLSRDRAMFHVAVEGLRPGEINNLRINDLQIGDDGAMRIQITANTRYRENKSGNTSRAKGADSTRQTYATNRLIKLWPFTRDALHEYIDGPRAQAIERCGKDLSEGFVFLKSTGEPISSRQAVGIRFAEMRDSLTAAGLIKLPGEHSKAKGASKNARPDEKFTSYVLRHSAASYYYESKLREGVDAGVVMDEMKSRFGWTEKSKMPTRYAQRAIVNRAMATVAEIYTEMRVEVDKLARSVTKGRE